MATCKTCNRANTGDCVRCAVADMLRELDIVRSAGMPGPLVPSAAWKGSLDQLEERIRFRFKVLTL
jgi:hypothetical protein